MNVFRVQCMGEEHRIALIGKRLAFLDHPRDELALMRAIGEKAGCLRFKEEWCGTWRGDSAKDSTSALLIAAGERSVRVTGTESGTELALVLSVRSEIAVVRV